MVTIVSVRDESKSSYRVAGRVMRANALSTDDDESPNSVTNHGRQTSPLFTNEAECLAVPEEIRRHVCLVILSIESELPIVAISAPKVSLKRRTTLNYV